MRKNVLVQISELRIRTEHFSDLSKILTASFHGRQQLNTVTVAHYPKKEPLVDTHMNGDCHALVCFRVLHVVSPLFFVLMNCVDMYMYDIDSLLYYYMLSASNESSICFQWFFTRNYAAQILTFFSCTLSFLSYQRIRNSRILFNFISLRIKMNYAGSDSLFSFKSLIL